MPVSFESPVPTAFPEIEVADRREVFTLRTLEEIEAVMAGVARSIEALDTGTYGLCEHCGTALRKAALVENPLATRCDAHLVTERPVLFEVALAVS
jgi:RNA polymerase-binding transcription factor DksA